MRKIFAIALAVVLLVSVFATLPAAAATFDQSTATDVPAIIATEVMANAGSSDAYEFIEFYNRGDTAINLYDLALARAPYYKSQPGSSTNSYYQTWNMWQTQYKFQSKMNITSGAVAFPDDYTALLAMLENVTWNNPASGQIAPHSFAIIWIVRHYTLDKVLNEIQDKGGNNNADLPRAMFREFYGNTTPNDVPIFYVWGDTALDSDKEVKADEFDLSLSFIKTLKNLI